jgi:hypothetical protein
MLLSFTQYQTIGGLGSENRKTEWEDMEMYRIGGGKDSDSS